MKVLLATEKPFSKQAVEEIKAIFNQAGIITIVLEKYTSPEQLLTAIADVDGLIVRSDKVNAPIIAGAPKLKIVVRAGAGYDNLDLAACSAANIVAMNTPGQNSNAVAELALGMMIYMARNTFAAGTGSELKGKTLGIHAYGNVGRLVALLGKSLGMQIYAFDPFVNKEAIEQDGVTALSTIEELYSRCRYVSLHIPATEQTKKSINAALIGKMPQGGTLINTARKEVIDETGLLNF
jgi:D-3-phosphoglycerate dehydrogenase